MFFDIENTTSPQEQCPNLTRSQTPYASALVNILAKTPFKGLLSLFLSLKPAPDRSETPLAGMHLAKSLALDQHNPTENL